MTSVRGDAIRERIDDKYEKTPGFLVFDLTEGCGQEMDELDTELTETNDLLNIDNLTGDDLTRFVWQRKGIARREATYATGSLTVTGNGVVIVGELFETEGGVQFQATEEVTIDGTGTVQIQAVEPGTSGMVGANTITDFPVTIEGIVSCTNPLPTDGGYAEEDDDTLRQRFYAALQTPATSGNAASYKNWAMEVEGVGNAQVFPLAQGNGTVDIVIIDQDMLPASQSLVTAVQNHIDPDSTGAGDGIAPIGAQCYVSAATGTDINISATLELNSTAVREDIETAIKALITEYLAETAFASQEVSYARIGVLIMSVEGVLDYTNLTVNGATANIEIANRSVAVLGTAVFTYDS